MSPLLKATKPPKKLARFQPGDEWEGSAGPGRGNKVRAQNEHAVKSHETAKTTALILLQMLVFYH